MKLESCNEILEQANSLFDDKNFIEALRCAEEALICRNGTCPEATLLIGLAHQRLNNNERAVEFFKKTEYDAKQGEFLEASFHKGVSLERLEKYREALEAWTKCETSTATDKHLLASYYKGILFQEMGEYREAISS
ncbi:MAG: hypothetical protein AAFX53_15255 [Bacteroidota bacterium]